MFPGVRQSAEKREKGGFWFFFLLLVVFVWQRLLTDRRGVAAEARLAVGAMGYMAVHHRYLEK